MPFPVFIRRRPMDNQHLTTYANHKSERRPVVIPPETGPDPIPQSTQAEGHGRPPMYARGFYNLTLDTHSDQPWASAVEGIPDPTAMRKLAYSSQQLAHGKRAAKAAGTQQPQRERINLPRASSSSWGALVDALTGGRNRD